MPLAINLTSKGAALLDKLAKVPDTAVTELAEALAEQLQNLATLEQIFTKSAQFKSISEKDAAELLRFLSHMCLQHLSETESPKELAKACIDALQRLEKPMDKALIRVLQPRLLKIFGADALQLKSKALRVMQSHDNVFSSTEIMSDIRPVFSPNEAIKIDAAVTFHTLVINYSVVSDQKRVSFALDSQDLLDLKKAVDRAVLKEKSIRKLIAQSGVTLVAVN